jgi:HAE1 family hydrophobic/amphiphilic exporter-1
VTEAESPELYNPSKKEIRVELIPAKMAALQLFPRDVEHALGVALASHGGGSVTVAGTSMTVQIPRGVDDVAGLGAVPVETPAGQLAQLSDLAHIDLATSQSQTQSFKTSGAPSIILFATPRPGGNVKKMSEDLLAEVRAALPTFPKDVRYRVLVDPSEFIDSAIENVLHEVGMGALLAVAILFVFIGSFRNTVTAAIEIPLSMILAFILMRLSGMNVNLISLGGLALSAGMNVDASVVVMENIFRHVDEARARGERLDASGRLRVVREAVAEVRLPVIASTAASLVVFLPLAFTSDLSYAILGDLAKTVVFSHGFSAFVALLLVPTVRLQLMGREKGEAPHRSPIEGALRGLEDGYARALSAFIASRRAKIGVALGLTGALALLAALVLPRLPREIVGRPDTDWIEIDLHARGNTLMRQMESLTEQKEAELLALLGDRALYTFTQVNGPGYGEVMARLRDKRSMRDVWKEVQARFTDSPLVHYETYPWNPSELPIPDPPNLRIEVRGGSANERAEAARDVEMRLEEKQVFPQLWTDPGTAREERVMIRPNLALWPGLASQGARFEPGDLADLARVATTGRLAARMPVNGKLTDIFLRYPESSASSAEEIMALPVAVGPRLVPLKALADVRIEEVPPPIYREDQRELIAINGKRDESSPPAEGAVAESRRLVEEWKAARAAAGHPVAPTISFVDAEKDLHEALRELSVAAALSVGLILMTLLLQFGSLADALIVLVAIPLGLIGVLASLFVFQSTLSLNSVLGVILLNGIAVANSILLVDFLKRRVEAGLAPLDAALEAGRKRLRPILITSLTTILGMMPIALGLGDGGRILQPLGIAVSGGLWVSMSFTLFVVPALQVAWLGHRAHRRADKPDSEPARPGLAIDGARAYPIGQSTAATPASIP